MTPVSTAPERSEVLAEVHTLLGSEGGALEGDSVVARPATDDEVIGLVRVARERGWRVLPVGAGLGLDLRSAHGTPASSAGEERREPDLRICTLRMTELLDHEPADLSVRVRAGLTLGALQKEVAESGQWLALDPPGGAAITLGGLIATGTAGPLRVQYGRPRDQLLGLTLIDGAGRLLALGGKVVKNVAGFDLVRLATGSRGALGIVTEATFRLYPRPEADRTLIWSREGLREAWEVGRALATLPLPFASAELVGGRWTAPLDDAGYRIVLRMTGTAASVAGMKSALLEKVGLPLRDLEGPESEAAATALSEGDGTGAVTFRVQTLPDRALPVLASLAELPSERLSIHLLQGGIRGTLAAGAGPDALRSLSQRCGAEGAVLRVLRTPGALPDGIESGVTADPSVAALHSRITEGFDPDGILPGKWREGWR